MTMKTILKKYTLIFVFTIILFGLFLTLILPNANAVTTTTTEAAEVTSTTNTQPQINIDFYYGSTCPHCSKMEALFEQISPDYNLNIKGYEVYSNNANRIALLQEYTNFGYDSNSGGVPTYVIEDRVLIVGELSESQITKLLDTISINYSYTDFKTKIKPAYQTSYGDVSITGSTFNYGISKIIEKIEYDPDAQTNNTTVPTNTTQTNTTDPNQSNQSNQSNQTNNTNIDSNNSNPNNSNLTWSILIPAALIDSINPCTFAVMAILLAAVLLSKGKKHVFWSGLSFALAIFISYMIMGFGVFVAVSHTGIQNIFYIIITVLAFIMAFFEIKSYFKYKAGFGAVEMPLFLRPKMKKLMRFVDSPITAFFVGLVCSLFLLPCSSGPYLMVLALLAKQATTLNITYLMAYNLIFILPLLLITTLVSFGVTTVNHIHAKKEKYIKQLHLISGILILLIINFLANYLVPVLKYSVLILVSVFELILIILLLIRFIKRKK